MPVVSPTHLLPPNNGLFDTPRVPGSRSFFSSKHPSE